MSFGTSPGVYPREVDQSFIVPATGNSVGAIVISSDKGPAEELTLITNNKQFVDTFGAPTPAHPSKYSAMAFLEKSVALVVVRALDDATTASVILQSTIDPATTMTVSAVNPGAWGNDIEVNIAASTLAGMFSLVVEYDSIVVESWTVSKNTLQKDGYGRSAYVEDVINGNSAYITVLDAFANVNDPAVGTEPLSGATNDTGLPAAAEIEAAFDMFLNKEEVNVNLLINAGWTATSTQNKMIAVAESRGDAFAILDMPAASTTIANMIVHTATTLTSSSSYAALYTGWIKMYDQYNDKMVTVAPSGHVAGVYAQTARESEVWFAPAGARRGLLNNVYGVSHIFTEGERDQLYAANINPIQMFVGQGIQVYGQKTLQRTPSALDRVNVRLLMINIQQSMERALRVFVFEQNDEFTRENMTSIVDNYMEDIKVRRGVTDYYVVINETNNTPQVIDNNQMIVDLYVKPTRSAEFIRLNTVITATGASFTQA